MSDSRVELSDAVVIALVVLMFLLVGTASYEDEVVEAEHYCELVRSGTWPDFYPEVNCEE